MLGIDRDAQDAVPVLFNRLDDDGRQQGGHKGKYTADGVLDSEHVAAILVGNVVKAEIGASRIAAAEREGIAEREDGVEPERVFGRAEEEYYVSRRQNQHADAEHVCPGFSVCQSAEIARDQRTEQRVQNADRCDVGVGHTKGLGEVNGIEVQRDATDGKEYVKNDHAAQILATKHNRADLAKTFGRDRRFGHGFLGHEHDREVQEGKRGDGNGKNDKAGGHISLCLEIVEQDARALREDHTADERNDLLVRRENAATVVLDQVHLPIHARGREIMLAGIGEQECSDKDYNLDLLCEIKDRNTVQDHEQKLIDQIENTYPAFAGIGLFYAEYRNELHTAGKRGDCADDTLQGRRNVHLIEDRGEKRGGDAECDKIFHRGFNDDENLVLLVKSRLILFHFFSL